jgi:hypothetical protein
LEVWVDSGQNDITPRRAFPARISTRFSWLQHLRCKTPALMLFNTQRKPAETKPAEAKLAEAKPAEAPKSE